MARGGYRPTAPQNNPMNVNALGGNGQSGDATQAARYVPQQEWGGAKELYNVSRSAKLAAAPDIEQSRMPSASASAAASVPNVNFNAPTQMPNVPVTDGADAGAGRGMSALGLMPQDLSNYMTAKDVINAIAANPNASPATQFLAQRIGNSY